MTRVPTLLAGLSAVALFAAPSAWAQEAAQDEGARIPDPIQLPGTTPAPSPAPSGGIVAIPPSGQQGSGSGSGSIGPGSLSDFSLGGPTKRPSPAPTPAPTPAPQPSRALPTPVPPPSGAGARAGQAAPPPRRPDGQVGNVTPVAPPQTPREIRTLDAGGPPFDRSGAPEGLTAPESGVANWPWLIALLGLIGAALFAWQLRRQRVATAGGPALERAPAPTPTPTPAAPRTPAPDSSPRSAPTIPTGTITTSALKPELTLEVEPVRAVFSDEGFSLDYRLTIANVGHGAAQRPTIRHDWLFASATQAEEFDSFLARPVGADDKPLPQSIPPQSAIRLDARAIMPLDKARAIIVEGRQLLLPILALGVRHGHQAPSQKPAAHGMWLIGRAGGSDGRMAPIRADQGPRVIRDVQLKRQ